jgi:two-component system torCAD operon response regulator TorR
MDTQNIPHLLVVEDEPLTRALLVSYFQQEGYRVSEAENGDAVLALLAEDPMDVVLLDIKLPGKDGLTLARELRTRSEMGIILITCKDSEIDRIVGLELGADVYVTKPFNPRELLAQVKNLLRRVRGPQTRDDPNSGRRSDSDPYGSSGEPGSVKCFEGWVLDFNTHLLTSPQGEADRLTRDELQLLSAFINNAGRVLSREQLLDKIRNRDWYPTDRTVDVLVSRLRRKLRDNPADPRFIITLHGCGYLFTPKVSSR